MKKNFLLGIAMFAFLQVGQTQNMITAYMPGFQLSHFKGTNVMLNETGERGDIKGGINHITFKGDGIANNMVFGVDVSAFLLGLVNGLQNDMGSYYTGVFEVRMGGAFQLAEHTKLGAGFDLGARGIRFAPDGNERMGSYRSYIIMGVTLVGLHSIGDKLYIMPKLSFDPIFSDDTDKPMDGMSTKFEASIGMRLFGAVGFSITPGFENLRFNYQTSAEGEMGKSYIRAKYLQFGLTFMID